MAVLWDGLFYPAIEFAMLAIIVFLFLNIAYHDAVLRNASNFHHYFIPYFEF